MIENCHCEDVWLVLRGQEVRVTAHDSINCLGYERDWLLYGEAFTRKDAKRDAGLTRFGVIVWACYLTGIGVALWLALWWTLLVFACCMAVVGLLAVVEGRAIRDDLDRREEVRG